MTTKASPEPTPTPPGPTVHTDGELPVNPARPFKNISKNDFANLDEETLQGIVNASHRGMFENAMDLVLQCVQMAIDNGHKLQDIVVWLAYVEDKFLDGLPEVRKHMQDHEQLVCVRVSDRSVFAQVLNEIEEDRDGKVAKPYRPAGKELAKIPAENSFWIAVFAWDKATTWKVDLTPAPEETVAETPAAP